MGQTHSSNYDDDNEVVVHSTNQHSSNDYELVIKTTKDLEYILERNFNAQGRGLHEKVSSCEGELSNSLVKKMRYLATIRNKLIHERGFDEIPNRATFLQLYDEAERELEILLTERTRVYTSVTSDGRSDTCVIS